MTRFDFPCGSCVVSVVLFLENWLQSGFTACNLTASEIVSEINKVKVLTLEAGEVLKREHLLCMSISRHSQGSYWLFSAAGCVLCALKCYSNF